MADELLAKATVHAKATVVLHRYNQTHSETERAAIVLSLRELFPNIRFQHHPETGLTVFCLAADLWRMPKAIRFAASVIIKVMASGEAVIVKNTLGLTGAVYMAPALLAELGGKFPQEINNRRSRLELIASDEDFL